MHNSLYGVGNSKIIKFILQPTGVYHDQYVRPYTPVATRNTVNKIIDKLNDHKDLSLNSLSDVATEIIIPNSTPEFVANIPNGWNTPRYKFYLVIESQDNAGHNKFIEHIVGYTNYSGVSYLNSEKPAIDPQMEFIINSILVYQINDYLLATGLAGNNIKQFNNYNILSNNGSQKKIDVLKPENVLQSMEIQEMGFDDVAIDNRCNKLNNLFSVDSAGLNNSPVHWVNRTIGSVYKAIKDEKYGSPDEVTDDNYYGQASLTSGSYSNAINKYVNPVDSLTNSKFKQYLADRVYTYPKPDNAFLFDELFTFNKAGFDYIVLPVSISSNLHNLNTSNDWSGSDILTQNAHLIALTFPEMMLKYSLTNVCMSFSNQTLNNEIVYKPTEIKSILENDPNEVHRFEAFAREYLFMYIRNILDFNKCSASIVITCSILGDIRIEFFNYASSIGSIPHIVYSCPNFSNSTFSSVITGNSNVYDSVVNEMKTIIGEIDDKINIDYQYSYRHNNVYEKKENVSNFNFVPNL